MLDAPTLFESGCDRYCDVIISVVTDEQLRLQRILGRDGLTHEEAEARIQAQHRESYYVRRSDFVIENNDTVDTLCLKVAEVMSRIETGERPRQQRQAEEAQQEARH